MSKIYLLLCLCISVSVFGQQPQQPLPLQCPGVKEKLLLIEKSFPQFDGWKKDSIPSLFKNTWTSDFVMCGLNAIVKKNSGSETVELVFLFDKKYKATDKEVDAFADKLRKEINEVFGKSFTEWYENHEGDEYYDASHSYTWKVNGSGFKPPKKRIELQYPYLGSHLALRFFYNKSI